MLRVGKEVIDVRKRMLNRKINEDQAAFHAKAIESSSFTGNLTRRFEAKVSLAYSEFKVGKKNTLKISNNLN